MGGVMYLKSVANLGKKLMHAKVTPNQTKFIVR